MNFLVVIPRFSTNPAQEYVFPVGIAAVASALKAEGFSVRGVDLNQFAEPLQEVIAEAIRDHSIDVIVSGSAAAHWAKVRAVLDAARHKNPKIITIVEGDVISSDPPAMMQLLCPHFGVLGGGERTVVELARELNSSRKYRQVNGLIFRDPDGELRTTPARVAAREESEWPYTGDEVLCAYRQEPSRVYSLVSSRSCNCKSTFSSQTTGDNYRQRTLDDLFREIEHSHQRNSPNHYRIIGDLFASQPERILEFCRRIKPYEVKWDIQMGVADAKPELLATMREAGCVLVRYGLESASQKVLESMRTHTNVADLVRAIDLTYEARLQVHGAFILGDPAETIDSAVETFSLWLQRRALCIGMWPIDVYPGTPLYQSAVKRGLIPDTAAYITNDFRSINLMNMPDREALQVYLLMYLLTLTYNRIPGRVMSCKPGNVVEQNSGEGNQGFDITVECPHCEQQVSYPGSPLHGGGRLVCHKCNRRFDIQPLSQWRHWPEVFNVSKNYQFQPAHSEEMKRFLRQEDWLGNKIIMDGHMEVVLFGLHYLVPSNFSLDEIRRGSLNILIADEEKERLDPVMIHDGNYVVLHNPFYLKARIADLVGGWRKEGVSVVVTGFANETHDLYEWTNLSEAQITGFLPLDPSEQGMASLGPPLLTLQEIISHPPNVLLISAVKNQRSVSEFYARVLSKVGVEIVTLYSSGS